jgi:hypothetical protein
MIFLLKKLVFRMLKLKNNVDNVDSFDWQIVKIIFKVCCDQFKLKVWIKTVY